MIVFFDLDDTLYPEMEFVRSAYRQLSARFGTSLLPMMESADSPAQAFDLIGEDINEILAIYREHKPTLTLPMASLFLLNHLKYRGLEMGLITDGRTLTQRNKIEALGLKNFLSEDLIFISEEFGAEKLTGKAIEEIIRRRPGEKNFIYIGDNPAKDFLQPNIFGWYTIQVTCGGNGMNIFSNDCTDFPVEYWPKSTIVNLWEGIKLTNQLDT